MKASDLAALVERVEAAEGADAELDALILCAVAAPAGSFVKQSPFNHAWCIYTGTDSRGEPRLWQDRNWWRPAGWAPTASLDAALGLVERVLPGARLIMGFGQTAQTKPWVRIGDPEHGADTTAPTLPLALCLALLRALQTQGEEHG